MGLTASLRGRARIVRDVRHGSRVEGHTPSAPVRSEWFACRVIPADARESDDGHGGRRVVARAQLVGRATDLRSNDSIEIDGGAVWRVVGEPEILQARSASPVVTVPLERVIEPPITSVA